MCILKGTKRVCYFYWTIFLKKILKSQIQPPLMQKQKNEEIRVTGLGGSGPTGRSSKHFSTKPGRQISAQGSPSDGKAETGPRALAKARPTNLGGPFPLRPVLRPGCRLGGGNGGRIRRSHPLPGLEGPRLCFHAPPGANGTRGRRAKRPRRPSPSD